MLRKCGTEYTLLLFETLLLFFLIYKFVMHDDDYDVPLTGTLYEMSLTHFRYEMSRQAIVIMQVRFTV